MHWIFEYPMLSTYQMLAHFIMERDTACIPISVDQYMPEPNFSIQEEAVSRMTKTVLADHMLGLLENESLDGITVKRLIALCNINPKTFYYNYPDKYALAFQCIEEGLRRSVEGNYLSSNWKTGMTAALDYIAKTRHVIRHISQSSYKARFRDDMLALCETFYIPFVESILSEQRSDSFEASCAEGAQSDLILSIAHFYSVAVYATLTDWFRNGCEPAPETMTNYLDVMYDHAITHNFDCLVGAKGGSALVAARA